MPEKQPGEGQLLSCTCHQHLQIGLGILFNKDKIAQQQLKERMLLSLWRYHALPQSQYMQEVIFVRNCITVHKEELTSSLKKEHTLWDSILDSEVQPTSFQHLA